MSGKPGKRQPPCTAAFRADAVRLVEQSGKSLREVAAALGLATESLRRGVQQIKTDAGQRAAGELTTAEREELRRRRREVATLRMEREILQKGGSLRSLGDIVSRDRFSAVEKARLPIALLCRVLRVARAGYSAWLHRSPSRRAQADAARTVVLAHEQARSRQTDGPRACTRRCARPAHG